MADEPPVGPPADETRRMRRAIRAIRREGWKVAVISATVDAALATVLGNLLLTVFRPAVLPASVPLPAALVGGLRRVTGVSLADPTVSGAAVVGVALGALVFVLEVGLRVRRPIVEQFEAANPALQASLRTARDAVEDGRETVIARRLYEEVLAELRRSSSLGLVGVRRLAVTVLLVAVLSAATVQVAVVGLSVGGLDDAPGGDAPPGGGTDAPYGGLQDPTGILGDPEDVPTGVEDLNASIDTGGAGDGSGAEPVAAYADSGYAGADAIERQRAGFAEPEQLEDADLIREYTLRIREGEP